MGKDVIVACDFSSSKEVFDFLDTKTGLMYCGDSEEFYLEILSVCIHTMPLSLPKKVSHHIFCDVFFVEAPTRFELVIEVLQTFALPLGYGTQVTPRGFEPLLPP